MTRLHVVDGTYELYRAHYSKRPPHTDQDGRDVKATVGLALSMLALLNDAKEAVTHFAVAFDNPIRSFRNDLFAGYKSDEGVPEELRAQFDLAEEALRSMGIVVWSMNQYECDDALAAAAARWAGDVEQVRIVASDKDLLQCVRGQKVVLFDRQRERVMDEESVRLTRGIQPVHIPDFLALVGDDADGIPGLAGFGEKSTAVLLSTFGGLEQIPLEPSTWPKTVRGAERLCATLAAQREDALLYRKLATLVTDVPLKESLDDLRYRGVPDVKAWESFCTRVSSNSLRRAADRRTG